MTTRGQRSPSLTIRFSRGGGLTVGDSHTIFTVSVSVHFTALKFLEVTVGSRALLSSPLVVFPIGSRPLLSSPLAGKSTSTDSVANSTVCSYSVASHISILFTMAPIIYFAFGASASPKSTVIARFHWTLKRKCQLLALFPVHDGRCQTRWSQKNPRQM